MLMRALAMGQHGSSLDGFYHVSRACLVKSETYFDAFDRVFARVFRGVEGFGASNHIHTTRILSLSDDLPMAIVIVDRELDEAAIKSLAKKLGISESVILGTSGVMNDKQLRYKNEPARQFLHALELEFKERCSNGFSFRISAEIAANLEFAPPIAEDGTLTSAEEDAKPNAPPPSTRHLQAKARLLSSIALELHDAEQIHKTILARHMKTLTKRPFIPPQTPLEEKIAAVWSEVLGLQQIDRTDDFFALGGHSLLAMQMLSRMNEFFQLQLSPTLLFTGEFTVAALARMVLRELISQAGPQNIAAILRKLEELSDDEVKELLADRDRSVEE